MTKTQFEEIFRERIKKVEELLITKAAHYASDEDRLHNFNLGARISGKTPAEVLDGFLLKHYISYRDILKDINEGKEVDPLKFEEKIGDIIVYFFLQEAVMLDSGLIKKKRKRNENIGMVELPDQNE